MDINKIPVLGRVNKTFNVLVTNVLLLALICLILGIVIPFYPQVLTLLVSAMLIVAAVIFINIAWHIHSYKSKYTKFFDE